MKWLLRIWWILGVVILIVGVVFGGKYLGILGAEKWKPGKVVEVAGGLNKSADVAAVEWEIEEYVQGLFVPWGMVFTSSNRMLVSERDGVIREVEGGQLNEAPAYIFNDVKVTGEAGLLGIEIDPNYVNNRYVYACLSYQKAGRMVNRVVRLADLSDGMVEDRIILDDVPAAQYHDGCRIKFGPDGKLYVTAGDATEKETAQDLGSLAGKILRMERDGSIPSDNPFGTLVYSYGHRNPQGIAWHPVTGQMLSTEHGPSIFDGPAGGDEVNVIKAGQNYGWPVVSHEKSAEGMIDPVKVFTPAVAPASAMVYSGKVFPQWAGDLFFGGLKGEGVFRVVFDATIEKVEMVEQLEISVGRVRDVIEGPDGTIYFTTSNRDGRGVEREGDDKIYRIVKK